MTNIEVIANFEREINKINDAVNKPATEDSLFWLNQGIAKFTKLRFNGDFVHKTGYEQTEKRRHDLISLFKTLSFNSVTNSETHSNYDVYTINYPADFLYALNEDVIIDSTEGGHEMDTCVFECTQDSFMYRINNSLTDFHYKYHRARPLRIRTRNGFRLLTDKNYKIYSYTLGYIKVPEEITDQSIDYEYKDFDDHIWLEITKIAAQMYVENQSDPRYKTLTNEVLTQE